LIESYTMLTMNADAHPLMRRMQKPDPKFGPHEQDKRSVVVIEADDFDVWLGGSIDDAKALIRLAPAQVFVAGPDG
jgi:putative SOS response-associated peptidase YedK